MRTNHVPFGAIVDGSFKIIFLYWPAKPFDKLVHSRHIGQVLMQGKQADGAERQASD